MKNFSKIISILLALTFAIACMTVFASAEKLDANLVTHYDFEGDTFDEALKDKATAGKAKDDLVMESKDATVPAASDFTWDKENGTLANLKDNVGLKATLSDDFKVNSANGTYFFRFKVTGGTGETGLFDIRTSNKRALAIGYKANGNKINVYAGYSAGNKNTQSLCEYDIANNPFINVAVTFEKNGADSMVKYYLFKDGDTSWSLVKEQTMAGGSWEVDATTIPRVFGTCFGAGATGRYVLDEIKIYNVSMTPAQISDNFGGDTSSITTTSETTTSETTTSETTTSRTTTSATTKNTSKTEDTSDAATTEATTTKAVDGGCGSIIGVGAVMIVNLASLAGAVISKKK